MNEVSTRTVVDTPMTVTTKTFEVEAGEYGVSVDLRADLGPRLAKPGDSNFPPAGPTSYLALELPEDEVHFLDRVRVDSASGADVETVRRSIEALKLVERALVAEEARNGAV